MMDYHCCSLFRHHHETTTLREEDEWLRECAWLEKHFPCSSSSDSSAFYLLQDFLERLQAEALVQQQQQDVDEHLCLYLVQRLLQVACLSSSMSALKLILAYFPRGLEIASGPPPSQQQQQQHQQSRIALHHALLSTVPSLTVMEYLIQKYPAGLLVADANGHVPLHLAVLRCHIPDEVLRRLIQACPTALLCKDKHGRLPLHYAVCQHGVNISSLRAGVGWEEDEKEVDRFDSLDHSSKQNWLTYDWSLYNSCRSDPGPRIACRSIELMILNAPESVSIQDVHGNLPVHWACQYDSSFAVLQCLVENTPGKYLLQGNHRGLLPISLGLQYIRSLSRMEYIIDSCPASLLEPCGNGKNQMALHHALAVGASLAVIEKVMDWFPEACQMKDRDGNLPLHVATAAASAATAAAASMSKLSSSSSSCSYVSSTRTLRATLQLLVDSYPAALWTPNACGRFPLHEAILNKQATLGSSSSWQQQQSHDTILFLIQQYPEAAKHADQQGYLPLHLALTTTKTTTMASSTDAHDNDDDEQQQEETRQTASTKPLQSEATTSEELDWAAVRAGFQELLPNVVLLGEEYNHSSPQRCNKIVDAANATTASVVVEEIQCLVNANPEAVLVTDSNGWYPFQRACLSHQPLDAVFLLLRCAPHLLQS